jgi:hypothetical protein
VLANRLLQQLIRSRAAIRICSFVSTCDGWIDLGAFPVHIWYLARTVTWLSTFCSLERQSISHWPSDWIMFPACQVYGAVTRRTERPFVSDQARQGGDISDTCFRSYSTQGAPWLPPIFLVLPRAQQAALMLMSTMICASSALVAPLAIVTNFFYLPHPCGAFVHHLENPADTAFCQLLGD